MSFTYEYPRPAVTTDVLLLTKDVPHKILLIQRGNDPFKGKWALPGGFVDMDEDLKTAALRELEEETGITDVQVQQFRTYGGVNRDPRHRTISVVYTGYVDSELACTGQDDAADAQWFNLDNLPELAFDHYLIVAEAKEFLNI
nr:NUDIX hydrolase [uncultured Carboxylicivirga sp.]